MNFKCVESSIGLDRLATLEEVRRAMSFSSPAPLEFVGRRDDCGEMDSEESGRAPNLREEMEWLMIVREMQHRISN